MKGGVEHLAGPPKISYWSFDFSISVGQHHPSSGNRFWIGAFFSLWWWGGGGVFEDEGNFLPRPCIFPGPIETRSG
jgi:hypothetical protein